jgi:SHS2 domain-containing protein
MAGEFRMLDDVALADAAFDASGDTPSDLFTAAAHAVVETMADPGTVQPQWQRTIEREAHTLDDLLFDWLCDLVYMKDAESVVFHSATAVVDQDRTHGTWKLSGTVSGAPIDPQRQEVRADVKAITKHLYEVQREHDRWHARVVVDI